MLRDPHSTGCCKRRRPFFLQPAGGARVGGFPGAARILDELASGPQRIRVGLRPEAMFLALKAAQARLLSSQVEPAGLVGVPRFATFWRVRPPE